MPISEIKNITKLFQSIKLLLSINNIAADNIKPTTAIFNPLNALIIYLLVNLYPLLFFLACELGFLVHCYSLYSRIV